MVTVLPFLTDDQRQQLENIVTQIVATLQPEKIICYGVRTNMKQRWSPFISEKERDAQVACDLLIIMRDTGIEKEHGLIDKLSKYQQDTLTFVPVIHSLMPVYDALRNGSIFFNTVVCKDGYIIYDSGNAPLAVLYENEIDKARQRKNIERCWNKWFLLGERFLASAAESVTNDRYDVATFMLHQAVELMCIASIRIFIGYRPTTHNLKRLFLLMDNYAPFVREVFPVSTQEEKSLFQILYRAYTDVRYREAYDANEAMVIVLLERVRNFRYALARCLSKRMMK